MPLEPTLQARLPLLAGVQSWDDARAEAFAAPAADWSTPPVEAVDDVAPGRPPVPVRTYRPVSAGDPERAVLWLHGGGFTGGDLDMPESDFVARELAHRAHCLVVTADYRLVGGGVHHPAPLDDVVTAWRWLAGRFEGPVAIGGASAGGTLACGAALRLRDAGDRVPDGMVLAYPAMHADLPEPSDELAAKLAELPQLLRIERPHIRRTFDNYVGPGREPDGYAVPALADLHGLPPTVLVTSDYDDLRSSGDAFAVQLTAAEVEVDAHCETGVAHGHLNTIGLTGGTRTLERFAAFIGRLEGVRP